MRNSTVIPSLSIHICIHSKESDTNYVRCVFVRTKGRGKQNMELFSKGNIYYIDEDYSRAVEVTPHKVS